MPRLSSIALDVDRAWLWRLPVLHYLANVDLVSFALDVGQLNEQRVGIRSILDKAVDLADAFDHVDLFAGYEHDNGFSLFHAPTIHRGAP